MRFKRSYWFFILAVFLWLATPLILQLGTFVAQRTTSQESINNNFERLKAALNQNIALILDKYSQSQDFEFLNQTFASLWDNHQHQLIVSIKNKGITYWTGTEIPLDELDFQENSERILQLKNGWYYIKSATKNDINILGLALICHDFTYENDYLQSSPSRYFNKDLLFNFDFSDGIALKGDDGKILMYAKVTVDEHFVSSYYHLAMVVFIMALVCFLFGFGLWIQNLTHRKALLMIALFAVAIISIKQLTVLYKLPNFIFETRLFSPVDYATSVWLPSLGDFFVSALLLFSISYFFFSVIRKVDLRRLPSRLKSAIVWIIPAFVFLGSLFVYQGIVGLVMDSSISLEFNDILSFNTYSIIAVSIIISLLASYFFLLRIASIFIHFHPTKHFLYTFLLWGVAIVFISRWAAIHGFFSLFFALLSFFAIFFSYHSFSQKQYIIKNIGLILIFAFAGTYILKVTGNKRKTEKQKLLAIKLSEERDPIAEFLFQEVESKISNDDLLKAYLDPNNKTNQHLRDFAQLYFNGYWDKYSIEVNIFGVDECPLTSLYLNKINDPGYFENLIDSISIPTPSRNFFYLDNSSGRISYLAKVPIVQNVGANTENLGTIYIQFDSRYTPEEIGYPELLLDKIATTNIDPSNYSNARYKDGKLTGNFGNFIYAISDQSFRKIKNQTGEFNIFKFNDFDHLVYYVDDESLVVVSFRSEDLLSFLTPFSYLFLIFSGVVLCFGFFNLGNRSMKMDLLSFKRKVQLSVVLLILSALGLIGAITIYFIIDQNDEKNNKIISEKVFSVLAQTEQMLGAEVLLNPYLSEDVSFSLARLSNTFFTDINIYDKNGYLYASSRKKVFEEGLLSKFMNPKAFAMLNEKTYTEFLQLEKIGQMRYKSAYVNLRNNEGEVLGYVNLPYFAKQSELRKEISGFLVAVININVLLLVIVVIAAIIISNSVTEPLRIIQEKLGAIRLGSKNEIIEWKSNDEIGDLVKEYNRMVEALSISAEMLAKSERESAWREMAKQVAHEIKNPLTPMKLGLQHLKRAYDDQAPDWGERLEKFTKTMIEQIETLSHIATEFSNFAKMPKVNKENIAMVELIGNVSDFYNQQDKATVKFTSNVDECYVLADKEQILRVFNNLLKNAMQATEHKSDGLIDINLEQRNERVIISIKDNGVGIPLEIREKIFEPNFTTKSSGMGLGLALVKNIVNNCDGNIWFESEVGNGAMFCIEMPTV